MIKEKAKFASINQFIQDFTFVESVVKTTTSKLTIEERVQKEESSLVHLIVLEKNVKMMTFH